MALGCRRASRVYASESADSGDLSAVTGNNSKSLRVVLKPKNKLAAPRGGETPRRDLFTKIETPLGSERLGDRVTEPIRHRVDRFAARLASNMAPRRGRCGRLRKHAKRARRRLVTIRRRIALRSSWRAAKDRDTSPETSIPCPNRHR